MKRFRHAALGTLLAFTLFATGRATAGIGLGDVLKVGGVAIIVSKFGKPLNEFINKLTLNAGVESEQTTKVVPILSVGKGAAIGAAQVSGGQKDVDSVKAVAQLEGTFKSMRVKALVPIESENIVKNIKRVHGVGVSAVIDIKL